MTSYDEWLLRRADRDDEGECDECGQTLVDGHCENRDCDALTDEDRRDWSDELAGDIARGC